MQAYHNAEDMPRAASLTGPVDFYQVLLTVKNGCGNGITTVGCYAITKAQAKKAGIEWQFVIDSVAILGLKIVNRHGRNGHMISK